MSAANDAEHPDVERAEEGDAEVDGDVGPETADEPHEAEQGHQEQDERDRRLTLPVGRERQRPHGGETEERGRSVAGAADRGEELGATQRDDGDDQRHRPRRSEVERDQGDGREAETDVDRGEDVATARRSAVGRRAGRHGPCRHHRSARRHDGDARAAGAGRSPRRAGSWPRAGRASRVARDADGIVDRPAGGDRRAAAWLGHLEVVEGEELLVGRARRSRRARRGAALRPRPGR